MSEKNNEKLQDKIMQEIKTGDLKIRSKYIILAEKIGIGSIFLFSLLIGVFALALLFYYLKSSENLFYLRFGLPGLIPFFESFPYLYLIISIPVILFLSWLFKKKNWFYKYPFKYIALALLVLVLVSSSIFAFTGVAQKIEERAFRDKNFDFLARPRLFDKQHNSLAGIILEIGDQYLILETPVGEERVELKQSINSIDNLNVGDFAILIGEREGENFVVKEIMLKPTSSMPLLHRNIKQQFFPGFNPPNPNFKNMK